MLTVALGTALGLLIGNRLPTRIQESIITGLGLVTLVIGVGSAGESNNIIIPLLGIVSGAIVGELLRLDLLLERFGTWLQKRFSGENEADAVEGRARFINGFVTTSLLFCIGPLTFVGSMMNGMGLPLGFEQLAIKSVLDGFAAMAFAASLGIGVGFSVITILIVQGGLALLGMLVGNLLVGSGDPAALGTTPAIVEMSAVGGLLLIGLSLTLLDLKKPRLANFLPALVITPLLAVIAAALNVYLF